jgi:hypothetical protein
MDAKYYAAINVATTLLDMDKDYYLDFRVDEYKKDSHFRMILTQVSSYTDNTAEPHIIVIKGFLDSDYKVWSDQINSYIELGNGLHDFNEAIFTDPEEMSSYIHRLLTKYSNKLGKEA